MWNKGKSELVQKQNLIKRLQKKSFLWQLTEGPSISDKIHKLPFVLVSFCCITKQPKTWYVKTAILLSDSALQFSWAGLIPILAVDWQDMWQLTEVIGQLGQVSLSLSLFHHLPVQPCPLPSTECVSKVAGKGKPYHTNSF